MNKNDFMEGVHILQNNYNKKLSTEQLRLYYENLKDMDKEKYISNIKEAIKNNSFMPNVAQIRNETTKGFADYKQRDYSEEFLNSLYANKQYV